MTNLKKLFSLNSSKEITKYTVSTMTKVDVCTLLNNFIVRTEP